MKKAIAILVAGLASLTLFCGCNAGAGSSEEGTTSMSTKATTKATEDTSKGLEDKIESAIDKGKDNLSSALQ